MATFASRELAEQVDAEDEAIDRESIANRALGITKSGPRKLAANEVTSIFNLKNELLKKKGNLTKVNLSTSHVVGKSSVLKTKKEEREAREREEAERTKRINESERAWKKEEEEQFQRAQQRLKDKAELYERLEKGNIVLENSDNTPVEFMVDFSTKKSRKDEERHSRNMDDEEPSTSSRREVIPERYRYDEEQRVYGVSHMRFSLNEEKRKEEIDSLLKMTKETDEAKKKKLAEKTVQEQRRLEKINLLRKKKGLPLLKEPSPPPEANLEDIPVPEPHETPEQKHIRLMKSDREWDRGKGLYTQWIEKQREDRDDEFRPPDSYYR